MIQGAGSEADVVNKLPIGLSPYAVTSKSGGDAWIVSEDGMPTATFIEENGLIDVTKNTKISDALNGITAYGTGTDATKNELALFGEKDSDGDGKTEELLISPDGKTYLAGKNGPEMIQVKAGTKVFNDKETSKILKGNVVHSFCLGCLVSCLRSHTCSINMFIFTQCFTLNVS